MSLLSTERVQGTRVAQASSSNSCSTPSRVASASNRRTYCAAPIKAAKSRSGNKVIVFVERRAGKTHLFANESVPSVRPVKRCVAPGAPTKVRCAPICPVARLPVRAVRGVCPGAPKKVWAAVPVFAEETIAFPRLEDCVEVKTSSIAENSTEVNVVAPKKKSCLRRLNAEPRRVQVTWGIDEVREFRFSASAVEGTTSNAAEKEMDSSIVTSSSASHATASSSDAVESVNGIVESDFGALMALADCAVAALEAMEEVAIVAVHLALPQPNVAVAPRRKLSPNPIIVRDARMATLRPRPFDRAHRRACVAMAFVDVAPSYAGIALYGTPSAPPCIHITDFRFFWAAYHSFCTHFRTRFPFHCFFDLFYPCPPTHANLSLAIPCRVPFLLQNMVLITTNLAI